MCCGKRVGCVRKREETGAIDLATWRSDKHMVKVTAWNYFRCPLIYDLNKQVYFNSIKEMDKYRSYPWPSVKISWSCFWNICIFTFVMEFALELRSLKVPNMQYFSSLFIHILNYFWNKVCGSIVAITYCF